MKTLRARLAVGAVLFLLGFLVVIQLRSQGGGSGLEQRGAAELTSLIANLTTANDELAVEIAALEQQLREVEAGGTEGGVSVAQLRSDLRRLALWSGLEAVEGRGVHVAFGGPVTADAVNDVLDELRASGAEALAVGPVRVVPGTVVGGTAGSLSVENVALSGRVEIAAIGDSTNLAASLVRADGVLGRIQATLPDVTVEVAPAERVTLPAATRPLAPTYARPSR